MKKKKWVFKTNGFVYFYSPSEKESGAPGGKWIVTKNTGYFTEYDDGYKIIVGGSSVGKTVVLEAMTSDPENIPVARDTVAIWD